MPSSLNHQTLEFIEKYLLHENPGQAIMLKGGWGCGKTWLLNHSLRPRAEALEYEVAYVSASGIRTIDELQEAVSLELIGKAYSDSPIAKMFSGVLESAAAVVPVPGASSAFGAIQGISSGLAGMFKRQATKAALDGRMLLVIDDLERCLIRPEAVFGYLSTIMAGEKSRLLLISNEDKARRSERYEQIKEKLVSHTLTIEADVSGFTDSFLEAWPSGDFRSLLLRQKGEIKSVLSRIKNPNLRAVRVAIVNCAVLLEPMLEFTPPAGQESSLNQTIDRFFHACFSATMFSRMLGRSAADYLNRSGVRGLVNSSATEESALEMVQEDIDAEQFSRQLNDGRYSFGSLPNFLPELVDHGRLDRVAIGNYLAEEFRTSWTPLQRDVHSIRTGSILSDPDLSAQQSYDRVFAALTSGGITSPAEFVMVANQLLSSADRSWNSPADVSQKIIQSAATCVFDMLVDPRLHSPHHVPETVPVVEAVEGRISEQFTQSGQAQTAREFSGGGAVAALRIAANDELPIFHSAILAHLDSTSFWNSLASHSNEKINDARSYISYRFSRGRSLGIPREDLRWLLQGIDHLNEIIAHRQPSVSRQLLSYIRETLIREQNGLAPQGEGT